MPELITDQLQRPLKDLRISLTDRCQFRCRYCLPAEHVDVMRQQSQVEQQLSYAEIEQVVAASAKLGVEKIRLTGGEPLLRKHVDQLIAKIKRIEGIKEVALTTNAGLLDPVLDDLVAAGLDRITISLDALDQQLFEQITDTRYQVEDILSSIDRCAASALKSVKLNCVIQKGVNESQIIPLLERFRGTGVVVRFIEFMDVGTLNSWRRDQVFDSQLALDMIQQHWPFEPLQASQKGEVANRFSFNDGGGEFGMISSISQPFCHDCNRARLSTQGEIFTCLFAHKGCNIKPVLHDSQALLNQLQTIWQQRTDQYSALRHQQKSSTLPKVEMFVIGG